MTLRDLQLRVRALLRPRQVEDELHEELAFHLERETKKLIDEGRTPEAARLEAQARFGSTALAADRCRDERGTTWVDTTVRDLHYALRTFARAPLAAATIVITVAIGLGVVGVLFTGLNVLLWQVDRAPNVHEMYTVQRPPQGGAGVEPMRRAYFEALRAETDVFTDVYATVPEVDLRVDGTTVVTTLVTGNFFAVAGVSPLMGRALTPADDSDGHAVVVLSDRGWRRRFNHDPGVLGRTLMVNGAPFTIVGVMPDGFRGFEVQGPDVWAPLSQLGQFVVRLRGRDDEAGVEIAGRLRAGVSAERARAQLAAWDSNRVPVTADRRVVGLELAPRRGTVPQPAEALMVFAPLFVVFGLILLIGCANVANLLLARGVARQREIGIRLSLGASRPRIIRQLMTESLSLALLAAVVGYGLSRVALEGAVAWTLARIPVDIGDVSLGVPAADWRVGLFLVVAAVVSTGLFALLPALHATRIDPVRTMRGELVKDARPGRTRHALIGVQVFASALLLITAAIFLRSALASARFDPGYRTADTLVFDTLNEAHRGALVRALAVDASVAASAAVRPPLLAALPRGVVDRDGVRTPVTYKFVSGEYFDVLGLEILRGRSFAVGEADGHPLAVVSESVARSVWPNTDAIGQTFRIEPDLTPVANQSLLQVGVDARAGAVTPQLVTVIGVARDVAGFRVTDVKEAGVFLPTRVETADTALVARVHGDPDLARQGLIDRLTDVDANLGMIATMRTVARIETFLLQVAFAVSVLLGGLALLLTVSGLFSVLSYLVEQRTREIGVRMALGASADRVTRLMLAQTTRPVAYGLVAGAALAAALTAVLLSTPVGALIARIVRVTDPVAYVGSLAVVVVACLLAAWLPATRASRVDPMQALRHD